MEYKFIADVSYIKIDDMVFPNPSSERASDIEWRMRYAKESITYADMTYVTSIISAYRELVAYKKQKERNYCCSAMKKCIAGK